LPRESSVGHVALLQMISRGSSTVAWVRCRGRTASQAPHSFLNKLVGGPRQDNTQGKCCDAHACRRHSTVLRRLQRRAGRRCPVRYACAKSVGL
jgi:hypothetical protein